MNACWNEIGVRGDGSCPELAAVVHCRNCRVHADAADALLDRDPPPDYVADWSRRLAIPAPAADDRRSGSVVVFRLADEWLAVSSPLVVEIAEQRPVHSLPGRRRGALRGVVNVRGELLACVSLHRLLALPDVDTGHTQSGQLIPRRMLVLQRDGTRAACPVDEVIGIHRFPEQALEDAPATVARAEATLSRGLLRIDGRSVGVLDDRLLVLSLARSLS